MDPPHTYKRYIQRIHKDEEDADDEEDKTRF
jgi:hypothetical protein